ncbi:hypothetical protein L596_000185 [Steinernema carpocapsae]|uniref:F-box domain-containing protein n=1 Tax=Steinernema carpocapsae TaxID=34508 RepID=A0A4U8UI66_STECR|nr:hypothetical protein L596_000185 [Steinernema carpocapsae]
MDTTQSVFAEETLSLLSRANLERALKLNGRFSVLANVVLQRRFLWKVDQKDGKLVIQEQIGNSSESNQVTGEWSTLKKKWFHASLKLCFETFELDSIHPDMQRLVLGLQNHVRKVSLAFRQQHMPANLLQAMAQWNITDLYVFRLNADLLTLLEKIKIKGTLCMATLTLPRSSHQNLLSKLDLFLSFLEQRQFKNLTILQESCQLLQKTVEFWKAHTDYHLIKCKFVFLFRPDSSEEEAKQEESKYVQLLRDLDLEVKHKEDKKYITAICVSKQRKLRIARRSIATGGIGGNERTTFYHMMYFA